MRDTERTAIQLLKPAMETALYEADVELTIPSRYTGVRGFYEDNLKVNKLAYAAIEEFDLPLLRTWYKYGQYEPYEEIDPKALEVGDNSDDAYVPSSLRTDVTQGDITEYLLERDLDEMFDKDLFDFLIENYREWDPEPYTDTYIASTEIIQVLEGIKQDNEKSLITNAGKRRKKLKQASIDLRYDLKSIETFDDELHEHAQTYLADLEDILRWVDETSEVSDEQLNTIKEARKAYHQYVWPWAAMQISLDKAKGPVESKQNFDESGMEILNEDKSSFNTYLTGWDTRLRDQNLKPRFSNRSSGYTAPESLKKLQQAALDDT
ncbi:hypothetical protein [Halobacterium salinarum]|uniref:hypothetical protein n=1 Tax=Halobacterium salinarum TaxID=2242 RepID=UPI002554A74A|nr:hypothetical protein [Halobacterium salinarum]MDL0121796.1 hypothetical protein [Halobacterium salinarum]